MEKIPLDKLQISCNLKESIDEELLDLMTETIQNDNLLIQTGLNYLDTLCSIRFDLIKKSERKYISKLLRCVLCITGKSQINEDIDTEFLLKDAVERIKNEDFESPFTIILIIRINHYLRAFPDNFDKLKGKDKIDATKVINFAILKTNELMPEIVMGIDD